MEQLIEFALFFAKVLVIFLAILGILLALFSLALKNKLKHEISLEDLNQKYSDFKSVLQELLLDKKSLKAATKEQKEKDKILSETVRPQAYVVNFNGDVQAHQVEQFREEITAILSIAKENEEAIICVESPGGTVHGYGLAAAQILRLKSAGIQVTVCVDKVAASGGYLMACSAHRILAAPFAIIGSIGVIAQVPNFHRILKKNDVDYEEITSGEFKRTVSVLGEITEKGRSKFKEQIEDTHRLFKEFVKQVRPKLDINLVATGEYWFGTKAKELNLIDEIKTSDEYLMAISSTHRLVKIKIEPKKTLSDKIQDIVGAMTLKLTDRVFEKLTSTPKL